MISWLRLDSTYWQSSTFLFLTTHSITLFIICLLMGQIKKVTCISQEVCNVLRGQKWSEIIYLFFIKLLPNGQEHTVGAEYNLGIPTLYAMKTFNAMPRRMNSYYNSWNYNKTYTFMGVWCKAYLFWFFFF